MDQAAIAQSPSSGSAPYSGQSRRRRKQSSSNSESHSRYQEYDTQSQYDDYATGNTDSEVFGTAFMAKKWAYKNIKH